MIYKVLKPELFKKDTKLLGKYSLWENKAMTPTHICHLRSFGSKADFDFRTDCSFWMGFNTKENILKIQCDFYGGTCEFEFTKDDLKRLDLYTNERNCIEYYFNFIDDLKENGVIGERM